MQNNILGYVEDKLIYRQWPQKANLEFGTLMISQIFEI